MRQEMKLSALQRNRIIEAAEGWLRGCGRHVYNPVRRAKPLPVPT
jgi:hypothetical protein